MVERRVSATQDAQAQPLKVSEPVYPAGLKAKISGNAVVDVTIDAHGVVSNPSVKSSTDPAFGAASVEAISQWRFVPQVKGGQPIGSTVEVPFNFPPQS
jgi:TonB family protein